MSLTAAVQISGDAIHRSFSLRLRGSTVFSTFHFFNQHELGFSGGGVVRVGFGDVAQSVKSLINSSVGLSRPCMPPSLGVSFLSSAMHRSNGRKFLLLLT